MHKIVLEGHIGRVTKQRNLFLIGCGVMIISNLLLGFKIATIDEQIVMVPGLRQEMLVSKSGVSRSYIEEMGTLFLSNLLDLSPSDIQHKKELILKYTSNSEREALKKVVEYFAGCERDYKRFNLTTYFSVKNLEIDMENLSVIAHGMLTSYYGKEGYECESEDYKLDFEYQAGSLRLKSFVRIVDEEKAKRDRAKALRSYEEEVELGINAEGNEDEKEVEEDKEDKDERRKGEVEEDGVREGDVEKVGSEDTKESVDTKDERR